jgi:hypothetical protein
MASDADEERLHEALLERAQKAVDAAAEIAAQSQVIAHVAAARRGSGLMSRCAWCGRYRVDDRWVRVEPKPEFLEDRTSHGICTECIAALRGAGLSV